MKSFDEKAMEAFSLKDKIGLVATVNPEGLPHITLITSIRAPGPRQVTLGEFCRGKSKVHVQKNHKTAFLVMTRDRRLWRGQARWSHLRTDGPEYHAYNDLPVYRYNAYGGIHTVHYLDLVDVQGAESLPMLAFIKSTLATRLMKRRLRVHGKKRILSPFSERLFSRTDALRFIAYVKPDGFPEIVPVIQCQAAGSRRLIFSARPYEKELGRMAEGQRVGIFALTMQMESVLVRGIYAGCNRSRLFKTGTVDIDWVYNSMPPAHGQIYPPLPLAPVTRWADFPRAD